MKGKWVIFSWLKNFYGFNDLNWWSQWLDRVLLFKSQNNLTISSKQIGSDLLYFSKWQHGLHCHWPPLSSQLCAFDRSRRSRFTGVTSGRNKLEIDAYSVCVNWSSIPATRNSPHLFWAALDRLVGEFLNVQRASWGWRRLLLNVFPFLNGNPMNWATDVMILWQMLQPSITMSTEKN